MRYTDVILNSSAMDQSIFQGIPRKVLVICPPRSGSSMLCRIMLKANIGIPHEYFNEFHIRHLSRRFGLDGIGNISTLRAETMQKYLSHLFAVRTRSGLFATKLQHKQYRLFIQKKIESELFGGAKLIYLTRKDVVAQAVSWHFAEITGRWSFETYRMPTPKEQNAFFDVKQITHYLDEILAEQVLWEYFFHKYRHLPLRCTYEDLQTNPSRVLVDIADHTGIALEGHDDLFDHEGPYESEPGIPTKLEVIEHVRRAWVDGLDSRLTPQVGLSD